uniref:cytochrome b-245 chaperone 1 n=1 Tax=Myxine glutinosa TaxID=7769 RepID=UPI00358DDA89
MRPPGCFPQHHRSIVTCNDVNSQYTKRKRLHSHIDKALAFSHASWLKKLTCANTWYICRYLSSTLCNMAYMHVIRQTMHELHLARSPTARSWAMFAALVAVGVGAAWYTTDGWCWGLMYSNGSLYIAIQTLESWEEVIFDKARGRVTLKTSDLFCKLCSHLRKVGKTVVLDQSGISTLIVTETATYFGGKGYYIVLYLEDGVSYPLTNYALLGKKSEVEDLRRYLVEFLTNRSA